MALFLFSVHFKYTVLKLDPLFHCVFSWYLPIVSIKTKADADYLNNFVEGSATYAPFAYAGAEIKASKISPSDFVRKGNIVVSNQLTKGKGSTGASVVQGVKGGETNPKTGVTLPYHFHIHQYNWSNPFSWFKQTPILPIKK